MVTHTYHLDLIAEAQSGDCTCLNSLAILVKQKMYPYLHRTIAHSDVIDDLMQETLLEMTRSVSKLRNPEKFWSWIHRIARSKVQSHFKVKYRENNVLSNRTRVNEYDVPERNKDDVLSPLISQENSRELNTAILQLNSDDRKIIILRYFKEESYAEIASLLNYSRIQARVKLFRARRELKKHLSRIPNMLEY